MEGSVLGVWVAHGEGRAYFPDASVLAQVEEQGLAPLRYVDDAGQPTQAYPFNPNGSANAIAGMCSRDGRHLALMPHPERCFLKWQLPWAPAEWKEFKVSPWMKLFQNAREWCEAA
jgi:phosphoribosylformylglycinamidine synthase